MEFKGRIYKIMPEQSGVNRENKEWRRLDFVFEYFEKDTDRYTDKVALSIMNERIKECDLHEGEEVTIGFGHTVREYQGRYYNDIRCYKIEKADSMPVPPAQADDAPKYVEGTNTAQEARQEENDNLPF